MPTLKFDRPDDDTLVVLLDGVEVASANHDEHGWSGIDLLEKAALTLGKALGATIEDEWVANA